jgi:hypothetical protein
MAAKSLWPSSGPPRLGRPLAERLNALTVLAIRPTPPIASTIPECPKSSNHPTSSGV